MDTRDRLLTDVERAELIDAAAEGIDAAFSVLDDLAEGRGLTNVATAAERVKGARQRITNLREHILTSAKLPEETVHVAEWGCDVLIRSLTARERADFMRRTLAPQQPGQPAAAMGSPASINWANYFVDIVLMTARDPEDGTLLFAATDRDALLEMPAAPVEALASVARRLSGLEDNALASAKSTD